jgi:hypothetical protein
MNSSEQVWKITAGTKVRTVYGEDAVLVTDWFDWEASVTVRTSYGETQRFHPAKIYIDGAALPYKA